jgi:NADPH2:quinone reductase
VIGTVSTEAKEQLARAAGADDVIRYDQVDFAEGARKLTGGQGVTVVYDGVGKTTVDGSLASLRVRGTLVLFGASSGPVPPIDPQRLNSGGSLFLTRPTAGHLTRTREEIDWRGRIVQRDHRRVAEYQDRRPLPAGRRAPGARRPAGRRTTGKLLLIP